MGEHSPGPWEWLPVEEGRDSWLMHSGNGEAALDRCVLVCEGQKWPPNEVDARLIAKAPELLAAALVGAGDGVAGGVHYECRCEGCEQSRRVVNYILTGKRWLRRCPCCGWEAEAFSSLPEGERPAVVCPIQGGCGLSVEGDTIEEAVKRWNTRLGDPGDGRR